MLDLEELLVVSVPPEQADDWLTDARAGIDFLVEQQSNEETILHASLQCTLVNSVLAPADKVSPPDSDDLIRAMIMSDSTWSLTYSTGGGEPDRSYVAPPLDNPGCNSLVGGEALVFRRSFTAVDEGPPRTEVSQKLVHALDLYWLDEENAYCRLDGNGDIQPVIRVIEIGKSTGKDYDIVVTIRAYELARYMAVTSTALVQKFDFTRFIPGNFGGWMTTGRLEKPGNDLFYNTASQHGASYCNGVLVYRTQMTEADVIAEFRSKWTNDGKRYAEFIAQDWKNKRIAEISCAPTALASYFEKDSDLPFQITPAFFKPEVLQRYKADPEKYSLDSRSISSRAGWHLATYDINNSGQVHTYLHYLGDLPYEEQLYWKSFNEPPKAPISERAFATDIEGDWTDIIDPLDRIKTMIREVDRSSPNWWKPRGRSLLDVAHTPVTTSPTEWAEAILALDQLLVEGFKTKQLRERLDKNGVRYDKNWGSLKLLQELLIMSGHTSEDGADVIEPLRQLHYLRSKVKGHANTTERKNIIKQSRAKYGGLKEQFANLTGSCADAFAKVRSVLDQDKTQ